MIEATGKGGIERKRIGQLKYIHIEAMAMILDVVSGYLS